MIVFPLFPAAVFVSDSSTKVEHDAAHELLNTNDKLFMIDKGYADCFDNIDAYWNTILKSEHAKNVCYRLILNFVKHGGTPFFCKNTDSDNLTVRHKIKKKIWLDFVRIVLQSCVRSGKITVCSLAAPSVSTSFLKEGKFALIFLFLFY